MKYIRTKDGEIICTETQKPPYGTVYLKCFTNKQGKIVEIEKDTEEIIAQADTIEKLCDYIFYKEFGKQKVFKFPEECNFIFIRDLFLHHCVEDVKFAILIDKGLIYVAKMNEKGELELL